MKKTLSILLALSMMMGIVGCAGAETQSSNAEPIELTMAHFFTKEEGASNQATAAFRESVAKFQADNPDIKLTVSEMAHDDYQVKTQSQASANDLPDIFMIKGSWLENFVQSGLLADITDYSNSLAWANDFYPGIFDPITIDGRRYASPYDYPAPSSIVYYNADLWKSIGYDALPNSWEEINAASEKFAEQGVVTFSLGNKDKWPFVSCWFSTIANRFTGSEWLDSIKNRDGKAKFTDQEFVDAINFAAELGQKGIINPDFNSITNQQADNLYCMGKAATMIEGNASIFNVLDTASDDIIAATKMVVMPQPTNATKGVANSTSGASGWFFAINSKLEGEKLEKAEYALFTMLGPQLCEMLGKIGNKGPVNVGDAAPEDIPQLRKDYIAFMDTYTVCSIYDVVLNSEIIDVLNTGLQEVLAGTKDAATLAGELQAVQDSLS